MADTERREWLDEFEERGWMKSMGGDGSIQYERPCRGATEWRLFKDGVESRGRPAPTLSLPEPRPGLWERLRRWGWR